VIRSIAVLTNRFGLDARLVIAGGNSSDPAMNHTPELERLARIAQTEGVADRVEFIGRCDRDRLRTVYSAADVFVTTPWYEPFGITPVEAMACGCPVVGSAVGGIQDTVVNGRTGYLVPPNDPVALAERLAQLGAKPAIAQRMGRAGLARARKLFTWARVARGLLDVYRSAAACASAPARSLGRVVAAPAAVARLPLRTARAGSAPEAGMGSNDAAAVGWK